jgi:UDP-3-O-[3-hydroxymyristoyl] glucosamine N-acyltransferase
MQSNKDKKYHLRISDYFSTADVIRDGTFSDLDEIDTISEGSLVYCQNLYYLQKAMKNPHVSAILCHPTLVVEVNHSSIAVIAIDEPRKEFFNLYIKLKTSGILLPQMEFSVGQDCRLHPSAIISPKSLLGNRVVVGANTIIEDYCSIGNDVEIGPNVVIGAEGLLTIRQPDGHLLLVSHAGGVEIGDGCQILAGAIIAKSLFRGFTHIGRYSQIGIMTNIGHGAKIGEACVVSGNTVIAGRTRLGNRVWVGASASVAQGLVIEDDAQIKMGSIVVANVPPGAIVSGNFAVNHRINMARYLRGAD